MANSKRLVSYIGVEKTKVELPTSVDDTLVRRVKDDAFTGVNTVEVDLYKDEIPNSTYWGAQNVIWKKEPTCTVSFNPGEGSGTMEDTKANINISFVMPTPTFIGPWNTEFDTWSINGTAGPFVKAGETFQFQENATAYALWKQEWWYPVQVLDILAIGQANTITQSNNILNLE